MDRQGDILVVTVLERPAINKLTLVGNKDIKTEDLTKGLSDIGLAEGNTFDRLALDRVTQELGKQYNNRGKYNVQISPTVSRLDRNRVDITILVDEGKPAKIRHINLIGNEVFEQKDVTDRWESQESNWLSWYRRDDQYSREKLSGDLEKLNEYYLDRGYIDFSVDSTEVEISPDKRDMSPLPPRRSCPGSAPCIRTCGVMRPRRRPMRWQNCWRPETGRQEADSREQAHPRRDIRHDLVARRRHDGACIARSPTTDLRAPPLHRRYR